MMVETSGPPYSAEQMSYQTMQLSSPPPCPKDMGHQTKNMGYATGDMDQPTGATAVLTANANAPSVHRASRHGSLILLAVGLPLFSLSCAARISSVEIVNYSASGEAQRYGETFDEAYYDMDVNGNVDLVLRRSEPGGGATERPITQIIHVRSFWRPIPGQTVAERTQINGTVTYLILSPGSDALFEGAGSFFFKENRGGDTLTGTLDQLYLKPSGPVAGGERIFERASLTGRFRATRNARSVVRITNEMDRFAHPVPPE